MGMHDDTSVARWVERRLETLAPRDDWHPDAAHARERFEAAQAARTSGRRLWSVTLATAALASLALAAPGASSRASGRSLEPVSF